MNFLKFNGVKVRYYWYTDHQLYFTANSAFHAFGFKGWYNYMQRHGGDFMLPEQGDPDYPYTYAVSWDGLLRFPKNCKDSTRSNNWWIDNHLAYEAFIRNIKKFVLLEKQEADTTDKKVAVDLDSPAHKHPATVAALQSLPKAKLPEPDATAAEPEPQIVHSKEQWDALLKNKVVKSGRLINEDKGWVTGNVLVTFEDKSSIILGVPHVFIPGVADVRPETSTDTPTAKPRQCPSVVEALFDKVTAALTRGGKEEDTFPRLAPKWGCSEEECALRMAEMKIARIETGKEKEDSYVDAIGYLVLAYNKFKERGQ